MSMETEGELGRTMNREFVPFLSKKMIGAT
jgi:hypothetical protein